MKKTIKPPLYGVGDKVKIVNYGHHVFGTDGKEGLIAVDINKGIVGSVGIVSKQITSQGIHKYVIEGIPQKHAWYDENQMEMVNRNPNRV